MVSIVLSSKRKVLIEVRPIGSIGLQRLITRASISFFSTLNLEVHFQWNGEYCVIFQKGCRTISIHTDRHSLFHFRFWGPILLLKTKLACIHYQELEIINCQFMTSLLHFHTSEQLISLKKFGTLSSLNSV